MDIHVNDLGFETVAIHNAVASSFIRFLNPRIPYVWILSHAPYEGRFSNATVPLNEHKEIKGEVRRLNFDLQLTTEEFIKLAPEFDKHGLELYQSSKHLPDSLDLSRIPRATLAKVLVENGIFLHVDLPHACETSVVSCYTPGYLATVVGD